MAFWPDRHLRYRYKGPDIGHQEYLALVILFRSQEQPVVGGCLQIPFAIPAMAIQGISQVLADRIAGAWQSNRRRHPGRWEMKAAKNHVQELANPETLTFQQRSDRTQAVIPIVTPIRGIPLGEKRGRSLDGPLAVVIQSCPAGPFK